MSSLKNEQESAGFRVESYPRKAWEDRERGRPQKSDSHHAMRNLYDQMSLSLIDG